MAHKHSLVLFYQLNTFGIQYLCQLSGIMQGIIDNDPELIQEQIVKAASVVSNTASALTGIYNFHKII